MTTYTLPPGFKQLRFQQEYAVDMAVQAFKSGAKVVTVDAPPGVGKTLLADVVRGQMGVSAPYLCKSHHLQEQAAADFPHAVLLKGRANYPTELDPTVSADKCTWRKDSPCGFCSSKQACPYERVKTSALGCDMPILNLAYFLTECNGPGRFSGSQLGILDECDLLEDQLLDYVELRYTSKKLRALGLDHIRWPRQKSRGKHGAGVAEHLRWLDETLDFAVEKHGQLGSRLKRHPDDDKLAAEIKELQGFVKRASWARTGVVDGSWFYDEQHTRWGPSIRFAPIVVDKLGQHSFFGHAQKWLCMSGTIGSGAEWLREVGYEGSAYHVTCPSPFDVEARAIRYMPVAEVTRKTQPGSWETTAKAVAAIRKMHPGERMLVHTTSYDHAEVIENYCRDPLVTAQARDKIGGQASVKWFEETDGACLVTPVLHRGYDGVDDRVRVIVVAKMPYPNLGDERIAKRVFASPHGRREGQLWMEAQVARTLMQMTSRGTRHDKDWSVTYIVDERFGDFYRKAKDQLSDWWKEALVWGGPWREAIEAEL